MRKAFSTAAVTYDQAAVLATEVGKRMEERLAMMRVAPARVADLGCATGDGVIRLRQRFPDAAILAIDFALPMLQAVVGRTTWLDRLRRRRPLAINADANRLPLQDGSVSLLWSNLMLHWLEDPLPALREAHRVLSAEGVVLFAMLGPDTLRELAASARALGLEGVRRSFHDMHDVGDMLMAAGFADPVMEMETITFQYASPRGFLRDQRQLGVRDELLPAPLGWRQWRRVFGEWQAQHQGRASFEIIYGHAWKPVRVSPEPENAVIRFHDRKPN